MTLYEEYADLINEGMYIHDKLDKIEHKFGGQETYGSYRLNAKFVDLYLGLWYCTRYYKPTNIIELGTGYGGCTIGIGVAAKENNNGSIINSYEKPNPTHSTIPAAQQNINARDLNEIVNIHEVDVEDTWKHSPVEYDMMYIDIDNTWERVYSVLTNNEHIQKQAETTSNVFIEGGAPAHPRMNQSTLDAFHNSIGREVFTFDYIVGWRVSLSKLNIITLQ